MTMTRMMTTMMMMIWRKGSKTMKRAMVTKMTWRIAILGVLVVYLPRPQVYADQDLLDSCEIEEGLCDFNANGDGICPFWKSDIGWEYGPEDGSNNYYARIKMKSKIGIMETRKSCMSAKGHHCLLFRYLLHPSEPHNGFYVYVEDEYKKKYHIWPNPFSRDYDWHNISVNITGITYENGVHTPIEDMSNFTVLIQGYRADGNSSEAVIGIDDLQYLQQPCPSTTTTTTTGPSTITDDDRAEGEDDDDSSSQTPLIIGVVGAGIVIIVVVVGVVVYCCRQRRNRHDRVKVSKHNKNDDNSNHITGAGEATATDATPPPSLPCVQSPASSAPPGYRSDDHDNYITIDDNLIPTGIPAPRTSSNSHSTAAGRLPSEAVPTSSQASGSPSRIQDPAAPGLSDKPGQIEGNNYNTLSFHPRPKPKQAATATGKNELYNHLESVAADSEHDAQKSPGAIAANPAPPFFHILEPSSLDPESPSRKRKEEEYNCLKFTKNPAEERAAEESVDGRDEGGKLYDRLHTGDEVYSKINRNWKPEAVIDAVYSHVV